MAFRSQPGRHTAFAPRVSVVVPVLNGMTYLSRTAPTLLTAARRAGDVEITYVDNGSTDGTLAYLESLAASGVRVQRFGGRSIGAMRNAGARVARGQYLSFLDADCEIPDTYFVTAIEVLGTTGAAATGCETHAPETPHWIEATWHDLHYVGRTRDVHYLNSANFFVSRAAFEQIGGFREELTTGEDSEIGQRLLKAGFRIREDVRVKAIHHGNPKSIGQFYRRTVWHGLGMFATVSRHRFDRPTAVMATHLVGTVAGLTLLFSTTWPLGWRLAGFAALQLVAPVVTVGHRVWQTRRVPGIGPALLLYWLYYWARAQALLIVLTGRARRYRK
jgi:glycosyltransferase involved in cell wall biosynthesis